MNPPALRATTSDENVVLLISNDLRGYFRGNRRRGQRDIPAEQWPNIGLASALQSRFMGREQVRMEQGTSHEAGAPVWDPLWASFLRFA
jgi:hypothetical protein